VKRGDYYLSQSAERFAVAFRALGGNEGRNRLANGKLAPKQSVQWQGRAECSRSIGDVPLGQVAAAARPCWECYFIVQPVFKPVNMGV
jgi:hypothetical protein